MSLPYSTVFDLSFFPLIFLFFPFNFSIFFPLIFLFSSFDFSISSFIFLNKKKIDKNQCGFIDKSGFPRLSHVDLSVGGVLINAAVPDVKSIALGGGTRIDRSNGSLGKTSVGFKLASEALTFGGNVATLTDASLQCGLIRISNSSSVSEEQLSKESASTAIRFAKEKIEDLVSAKFRFCFQFIIHFFNKNFKKNKNKKTTTDR